MENTEVTDVLNEDSGENSAPAEADAAKKQSREEDSKYAAARRRAEGERDRALAEARRESDERIEKMRKEYHGELIRLRIEEDIRGISAIDPEIKSLKDITAREEYPRVLELVKRGNSLSDAYRLANFDRITQNAAAKGAKGALNSIGSRAHLHKAEIRGISPDAVPAEVMESYRALMPDISEGEIRKHYAKYLG